MTDFYREALARIAELLEQARFTDLPEPTAMTLATADAQGRPSVRTVLLKDFDPRGFVFYTNQRSRKGAHLAANPRAALCLYWQPLARQVHIEGTVEEVDAAEADAYWATRPRESRVGAWASAQSEPLESRAALEARFAEHDARHPGERIPRPPHWSGYRVVPERIEIWEAGDHRLHHRTLYEKTPAGWTRRLLNP
jgi:pyridoxamine 5'-phosphate oxidase